MKRQRTLIIGGCGCLLAALALPIFGMGFLFGAAAFLDSTRQVLTRERSPDGRWVAQLERIEVGAAPNMVITVRRAWQPDWYLTSCKAAAHYGDSKAALHWAAPRELLVDNLESGTDWKSSPPFRWSGRGAGAPGCPPIHLSFAD